MVKVKEVVKDLEKLKDRYDDLRSLIADQVRDDQITEARGNFEKLESLGKAIEQLENLNVEI